MPHCTWTEAHTSQFSGQPHKHYQLFYGSEDANEGSGFQINRFHSKEYFLSVVCTFFAFYFVLYKIVVDKISFFFQLLFEAQC